MEVDIFPHLSSSLLSIIKFVDAEFYAKYNTEFMSVYDHEGKEVQRGNTSPDNWPWINNTVIISET